MMDPSKPPLCLSSPAVDPVEGCSTDERAVLDQLSEHFKQINDILALVESEDSREVELAVNCDSLDRLTPPNQGRLLSPGEHLQSSLTSPLNSHVIDDLIRDSVQTDTDPLVAQNYSSSVGDRGATAGSPDDPESRTRRTLQTLAQLAELVDKSYLSIPAEVTEHCLSKDADLSSGTDPDSSRHSKTSPSNFRPPKPVLLISKVKAARELLKRRKLALSNSAGDQKTVNEKALKAAPESSLNLEIAENNSRGRPVDSRLPLPVTGQSPEILQNVVFVQCENNQIVPIVIVPQPNEPNSDTDNSGNNTVPLQPVIFIPYTTGNNDDSRTATETELESQPFIIIPPVNADQNYSTENTSSGSVDSQQLNVHELSNANDETRQSTTTLNASDNCASVVPVDDSLQAALIAEISSDGSEQSLGVKSDDDDFKCQYCSATFNRFCNFTKHLLVHNVFFSEDDLYKCEFCDKKFLQRCDLNRHLLVHNGTEPHRCEICNKAYIRKSDLVVHQRYHTKEKPFSCKICSKAFAQTGDLSRHVRRVHEKAAVIRCGHCKRKYAKEATLMRHMKVAHQNVILQSIIQQQQ